MDGGRRPRTHEALPSHDHCTAATATATITPLPPPTPTPTPPTPTTTTTTTTATTAVVLLLLLLLRRRRRAHDYGDCCCFATDAAILRATTNPAISLRRSRKDSPLTTAAKLVLLGLSSGTRRTKSAWMTSSQQQRALGTITEPGAWPSVKASGSSFRSGKLRIEGLGFRG